MTTRDRLTIAIDGYSSCGKSTFAKMIAHKLEYVFIDSGAMYRAITFEALRCGAIANGVVDQKRVIEIANSVDLTFNDHDGVSSIAINGVEPRDSIRTLEVSGYVSEVSAIAEVRERLVAQQQAMGCNGGVVMDGRDIGSVVFPDAEIKLFMVADPRVRGERRFKEMAEKGIEVSLEEVIENVISRDRADETRAVSPLQRTEDAILLDNSDMSFEQQMEWFDNLLNQSHES